MRKLRQVRWNGFFWGAFGRTEREHQQLVQRLALLRADYNRLKQNTNELLNRADREMGELKQTNAGLALEFDDLQLRVWELEQQVDELLLYIARVAGTDRQEEKPKKAPDLSWMRLGIVGGHEATCREVVNELSLLYGLQRWMVVPPSRGGSFKKSVLKDKLAHCDLIVIVTGYMNHSLTHMVFGLKASGGLKGKVVLLNFRGKSGVVREILRQVALLA